MQCQVSVAGVADPHFVIPLPGVFMLEAIKYVTGDLCNLDAVEEAFKGPDGQNRWAVGPIERCRDFFFFFVFGDVQMGLAEIAHFVKWI